MRTFVCLNGVISSIYQYFSTNFNYIIFYSYLHLLNIFCFNKQYNINVKTPNLMFRLGVNKYKMVTSNLAELDVPYNKKYNFY